MQVIMLNSILPGKATCSRLGLDNDIATLQGHWDAVQLHLAKLSDKWNDLSVNPENCHWNAVKIYPIFKRRLNNYEKLWKNVFKPPRGFQTRAFRTENTGRNDGRGMLAAHLF